MESRQNSGGMSQDNSQRARVKINNVNLQSVSNSITNQTLNLITRNANANICQMDHRHVIGAVTNGQCQHAQMLFDQSNHRT